MFIPCLDDLIYRGVITSTGREVTVTDAGISATLNPHIEIAAYSPIEMGWGFYGSAAKQTALAITADYLMRLEKSQCWPYHIPVTDLAIAIHGTLLRDRIAGLNMTQGWFLTGTEIWQKIEDAIKEIRLETQLRAARIAIKPGCGQTLTSDADEIGWSW